jgi:glutathione S-transferase
MKLYGIGPARSLRPRWTLQELDVPFESVTVNVPAGEHYSPAFLAINPAARIPVLVDGDFVLTESVAICVYLADKYPAKRFMPTDLRERADALRWLFFAATELEQPLWRITRNTRLYPESIRQPGDVDNAAREFREMANVLDQHMQGREYVVGDHATVVDFVTAYTLDWATVLNLLGDFPKLEAYVERMYARPKAAPRIAVASREMNAA